MIGQSHKDEDMAGRTLERTLTCGSDRPIKRAGAAPGVCYQRESVS